jgi:type I restriction enzyme M protein
MITGELKNRVDRIWEIFWTGGVTNSLAVIEQITYLLFIRGLDEVEEQRQREAKLSALEYSPIFPRKKQHLRWSRFKDTPAETMYCTVSGEVFPFIKSLHADKDSAYSKYMADAFFIIPTPQMLEKVVTGLSDWPADGRDTQGDLYEYLLSKLSQAGTNGQFRTPRHIIAMIVELMRPTPDDVICDPAAGSAGFLVAAGEFLRQNYPEILRVKESREHFNRHMFYGFDTDRTMLRIGAMNMMLHGVEYPNIDYRDSLSGQNPDIEKYTLVMANPPFKGTLDPEAVAGDLLAVAKTKKTELLFLALFLRILTKGGRCASIVPEGVLFGRSQAHGAIRTEIVERHKLEAIISMPGGVFKPYAGVTTAIIIFTKTGTGGTDRVWFYDMKADGFSLDDKRSAIGENDIPDIVERFGNRQHETGRKPTDQSFFVTKAEIVAHGYDLSIKKYKEPAQVAINYGKPQAILQNIRALEDEIVQSLEELGALISDEP